MAYNGSLIHTMLNEFYFSEPTPSCVPCLPSSRTFPSLSNLCFYLIFFYLPVSSQSKVFSSLSPSLKRQKSFSLMLPSAVNMSWGISRSCLVHFISSLSLCNSSTPGFYHYCFTKIAYSKDISNSLRPEHTKLWFSWSIQSSATGAKILNKKKKQ